jgi:glyoxalase family protein
MATITGLHHVTAFAKDPRENHDFYTRVLGLRLVKKTVNFDDPFTYHLYFGDAIGSPGTLMTTFPQPMAARARHGGTGILETIFAVPTGSLGRWKSKLTNAGIALNESDSSALRFADPDGMLLGLVEAPVPAASGEQDPADRLLGIERSIISVPNAAETIRFLETGLGFTLANVSGPRHDLILGSGGVGQRLSLLHEPDRPRQPMGAGTVHHIAWRVPTDAAQAKVADDLRRVGVAPTMVMDRQYFRSIYFRIPGGVLFEVATDGPGFDVDEPRESLGNSLQLPPQHEAKRKMIAQQLVPLGT